MIGRVDIEGSKNNVALNALLSDLAASEPKPPGKKSEASERQAQCGVEWFRPGHRGRQNPKP